MERQRFQPVRKITAGKYTIQGSIGACRCAWLRHRMAEKTGEVIPRQQPSASPVPIGAPQCCPWTGSERYGFRCHRLQEMFRRTASCRRADQGKRRRHFALVSRGHRSDRIPPPEEPSESPRHFAASMDESVIVGYYTLKKCRSPQLSAVCKSQRKEYANGKK